MNQKKVTNDNMKLPFTVKNRKGDTYYLKRMESKTGKSRYFFSKKVGGELLVKIPDGYEVYENPNAQVLLRKKLKSEITPKEVEFCRNELQIICNFNSKAVIVDYKKSEIIIHYSEEVADWPERSKMFDALGIDKNGANDFLFSDAIYHPLLKFKLVDKENRLYTTERYCFLGGIDDWIEIGEIDTLQNQVWTFGEHLGNESFYELY